MRIESNNISFGSGLSSPVLLKEKFVNVAKQTKFFQNKYGVETNFLNNKSAALANKLCADIFEKLSEKSSFSYSLPPAIFIYKKGDRITPSFSDNFCIPDSREVLRGEYPFAGRSIFFKDFENLEVMDDKAERMHSLKNSSSSHFLHLFIHEWLHSIHLDYIYQKFGYGGECEYLKKNYPLNCSPITGIQLLKELETKTLSKEENEIVFDNLGSYATEPINQYLEVFSEAFSKFICSSLKDGKLVKDPMDEMRQSHPEFQKILNKIIQFK